MLELLQLEIFALEVKQAERIFFPGLGRYQQSKSSK